LHECLPATRNSQTCLQPAFVNMLIRKSVPAEFLRRTSNSPAHAPHPHSRYSSSMVYSTEIILRKETR